MGKMVEFEMVPLGGPPQAPYKFLHPLHPGYMRLKLNFWHLSKQGHLHNVKENPP